MLVQEIIRSAEGMVRKLDSLYKDQPPIQKASLVFVSAMQELEILGEDGSKICPAFLEKRIIHWIRKRADWKIKRPYLSTLLGCYSLSGGPKTFQMMVLGQTNAAFARIEGMLKRIQAVCLSAGREISEGDKESIEKELRNEKILKTYRLSIETQSTDGIIQSFCRKKSVLIAAFCNQTRCYVLKSPPNEHLDFNEVSETTPPIEHQFLVLLKRLQKMRSRFTTNEPFSKDLADPDVLNACVLYFFYKRYLSVLIEFAKRQERNIDKKLIDLLKSQMRIIEERHRLSIDLKKVQESFIHLNRLEMIAGDGERVEPLKMQLFHFLKSYSEMQALNSLSTYLKNVPFGLDVATMKDDMSILCQKQSKILKIIESKWRKKRYEFDAFILLGSRRGDAIREEIKDLHL